MTPVGSGSAKRERKKKSKFVYLKEFLERHDVTDQTNCNEELLHAECIAFMSMLEHMFQYNGKKQTEEHFIMHTFNLQFEGFSFFLAHLFFIFTPASSNVW